MLSVLVFYSYSVSLEMVLRCSNARFILQLSHTHAQTHTPRRMELYQAEMVRWRGWAHDKTVERNAPGDVVYSLVSKNCVRFVGIAVQLSSLELTLVAPTTTVQSDTHVFSDIVIVGIVVGVYILFMMVTAGIFVMLRYRNIRVQRTAIDMENSVFRARTLAQCGNRRAHTM